MSGQLVTKRYARALFEVAQSKVVVEMVRDDVEKIESIVKSSKEIFNFCLGTNSSMANQLGFIAIAFKPYINEITFSSLEIAVQNGRVAIIPFLRDAFNELYQQFKGVVDVEIETARVVSGDVIDGIAKKMAIRVGGTVNVLSSVDNKLIAGYRIRWQGREIDNSAYGRLRRLSRVIKSV